MRNIKIYFREAISNLINSRSSNRLNAANEILFGQSNPFSYKSDRDVPQVFNQNSNQVVFKDRNSLNFNGYESYIDKQERLVKIWKINLIQILK